MPCQANRTNRNQSNQSTVCCSLNCKTFERAAAMRSCRPAHCVAQTTTYLRAGSELAAVEKAAHDGEVLVRLAQKRRVPRAVKGVHLGLRVERP